MKNSRSTFATRFGFYMAAIGSAFGLGTFWRFPYIVGANGGGAFVVLYLFFVAAIALPALICELMLGRTTRKNIIGAMTFKNWVNDQTRWAWFGRLGIIASFIILSYYTVISGWVIHFVIQGIFGRFTSLGSKPDLIIDQLSSKGFLQMALASVHLIITASIVSRGVQNGIEKTSRIFMSILFLVLIFILAHSLFLPGAMEAMRFLFYPDFTKLKETAVIEALGHALYTVSLGFGGMIVYGSYLKKEIHLPGEAFFVVAMDTAFSLIAGLLIFPVVFTAKVDSGTGATLLFKTMPVLFNQLAIGYWVALAFFICLYFSALSASIAVYEGLVAYFMDQRKYSRPQATYMVAAISFILGIASAYSGSLFKNIHVGGKGLLEIIDQIIINWMLPIVTAGVILFVAKKVPKALRDENFVDEKSMVSVRMYPTWEAMIKYVVPTLLVLVVIIQMVIAFRN